MKFWDFLYSVGDLSSLMHNMQKFLFMGIVHSQPTCVATVNTAADILKVSRHMVQCWSFYREKKVKICAMVYSNEERVFIIKHYFIITSFKRVQELFQNWFLNCRMPNKSTIQRIVELFHKRLSFASGYISWQRTLTPEKDYRSEQPHMWRSNATRRLRVCLCHSCGKWLE